MKNGEPRAEVFRMSSNSTPGAGETPEQRSVGEWTQKGGIRKHGHFVAQAHKVPGKNPGLHEVDSGGLLLWSLT